MKKDKLVIIGCGGHAKAVLDVVLNNGDYENVVLLDDNAREGEKILGYDVVKDCNITTEDVFVGIGDNKIRTELCKKYYENLTSIVSKNAYIGAGVTLGKGVFVAHRAHIGVLSQVGDFAVINTSASVDHECVIGEGAFIAPNSTLCGKVVVGKNCLLGAGATAIDNMSICDDTKVGAGAVVVKKIETLGTYVGAPARVKVGK
jgi:sugar O-acyltransferase (sialic acid O-acetyltransferase NeuD family)